MNRDLYQWLGNPAQAESLKELLGDVVLQKAFSIAQQELERPLDLQDGSILERAALAHAEAQGARALVAKLIELANPTDSQLQHIKPVKPLPPAYSHHASKAEKHSVV